MNESTKDRIRCQISSMIAATNEMDRNLDDNLMELEIERARVKVHREACIQMYAFLEDE